MNNSPGRAAGLLCFIVTLVGLHAAAAQEAPWRVARWNPDSFGNQRVVLHVDAPDGHAAVRAIVAWRRRDARPETKRWLITDDHNVPVRNALALHVDQDSGDVVFEPMAGAGDYYLYYLPYAGSVASNYPRISYPRPDSTAMPDWSLAARSNAAELPRARVIAFEAADSMSQRWPMEVPASREEAMLPLRYAPPGQPFIVFLEDRVHPVIMPDRIPLLWAMRSAGGTHQFGPAEHGEYYTFQVAVWAQRSLDSVRVRFSDAAGRTMRIPGSEFSCINTDGVDWLGRPFRRDVSVATGRVMPLWCGVTIPQSGRSDTIAVKATVSSAGGRSVAIGFSIVVATTIAVNHGDDEPWRLSRLRWLNSTLGADGPPPPPYVAVRRTRGGYAVLGRTIDLAPTGLPRQVTSAFTTDLALSSSARAILADPIALDVVAPDGVVHPWHTTPIRRLPSTDARAAFAAHSSQGTIAMDVHGELDFDGSLEYRVGVVSHANTAVRDIRLTVPFVGRVARFFMGMNEKGGYAPAAYDWHWDVTRNQDAVWIGDVNAGLQLTLKDEHYVRPLNTNFYQQSPLVMPRSWANGDKGSCRFIRRVAVYRMECSGGPRTLVAGDTLWFNFRVLVTPFHPVDTRTHFATRYFHAYKPLDTVRATGANLVNVHHGTAINPYLNYPFLRAGAMRAYADSLHAAGMRFKIYYTVRELTNRAPEFWALRSLGHEVFSAGNGGGHSWLQEHVVSDYLPGWVVPEVRDMTLVTNGISRWHNFYVEGLRWLTEHAGVDGIYLDDVAFDRATMLRIRRVLVAHGGPGERIDLHSANQYDHNDGFASSANLYLEHFPFIDRLWFGEGFNYDSPPDYWLVEMSGIPFGLMGEMLEGGGNPWRGMLFGMTNRLPWTDSDPRALWQAWDAFGITRSTMRGWWSDDAPVRTDRTDVLATTYQRPGHALVAVASWAKDTAHVSILVNWRALGLDSARVTISAPAIASFQPARTFAVGERITIAPGRGWLLRLDAFDGGHHAR